MAQPDVLKRIALFEGDRPSIPTAACANASLTATSLIDARRKELIDNRAMTVDYLTKRGLKVIGPSHGNMVMVDWKTKIGQGNGRDLQGAWRADRRAALARLADRGPHLHRQQDRDGRLLQRFEQDLDLI